MLTAGRRVHLTFDEKLMLTMSRDGALEQMEIKGDLYVTIASADKGLVTIKLAPVDQRVWKFSTHPKINKQAFASDLLLTLADNTKPFPAGNALGVVKWRVGGKDEALVPVRVSCWVTPSPTSTSVSLEYELLASGMELRNFAVTMQVPGAAPPVFEGSNEGAAFNAKQRTLTWTLPLVDASNGSATLDFTVNGTIEQAAFFPIRVNFASPNTLCPLHVQEVVPVAGGAPQKFSVASSVCFARTWPLVQCMHTYRHKHTSIPMRVHANSKDRQCHIAHPHARQRPPLTSV